MKKAGAEGGAEGGRLTKEAKRRQNKLKKKAEEEAKQPEIEAVKKAIETFNVSSDTEVDSLKKSELHSARQARLFGAHSWSLYKELNEMASGSTPQEVKKLGDEIFKAYRAAGAESLGDDSAPRWGRLSLDTLKVWAVTSL